MKNYDKSNLEEITKTSLSIADVCRKLNVRPIGGNYKTVKKYIKLYEIDISHFTGQGWNCGKRFKNFGRKCSLDKILVQNSTYSNTSGLRRKLIENNLKENICENCGIYEWNGKPLTLHLDHVNGDNLDNRITNLKILCPNCHSQTVTYCNSKIKSSISELRKKRYNKYIKSKNNFCECGKQIQKRSNRCYDCDKINQRKIKNRPSLEILLKDVKETNYVATGKKYGVSDNAIRKWIRNYKAK